jgi:cobalt/nickel transport system permease protein
MNRGPLDMLAAHEGPLHRLDARVKILAFLCLMVVSVSTPPGAYGCFAGYFAVLMAVLAWSRVPATTAFRRSLIVIPFVLMAGAFIPFVHPAGGEEGLGPAVTRPGMLLFWSVLIKAYIGVWCVILLSATTPFPKLLDGLARIKAPGLFILLAGFMYRYLFVLGDEAMAMKRARDARAYGGKWLWHAMVIGHMVGTLFLRSYHRAERVYLAMVSRGFEGKCTSPHAVRLRAGDYAFLTLVVSLALILRVGVP